MRTLKSEPVFTTLKETMAKGPPSAIMTTILSFLETRIERGIQTYGEELHTFNGRDALADVAEELGDAFLYMAQYAKESEVDGKKESAAFAVNGMAALAVSLSFVLEEIEKRSAKA